MCLGIWKDLHLFVLEVVSVSLSKNGKLKILSSYIKVTKALWSIQNINIIVSFLILLDIHISFLKWKFLYSKIRTRDVVASVTEQNCVSKSLAAVFQTLNACYLVLHNQNWKNCLEICVISWSWIYKSALHVPPYDIFPGVVVILSKWKNALKSLWYNWMKC